MSSDGPRRLRSQGQCAVCDGGEHCFGHQSASARFAWAEMWMWGFFAPLRGGEQWEIFQRQKKKNSPIQTLQLDWKLEEGVVERERTQHTTPEEEEVEVEEESEEDRRLQERRGLRATLSGASVRALA